MRKSTTSSSTLRWPNVRLSCRSCTRRAAIGGLLTLHSLIGSSQRPPSKVPHCCPGDALALLLLLLLLLFCACATVMMKSCSLSRFDTLTLNFDLRQSPYFTVCTCFLLNTMLFSHTQLDCVCICVMFCKVKQRLALNGT